MENEEILEKLKELTQKEVSLSNLCSTLELSEYEVLGLVRKLHSDGINILTKKHDDDIYLLNLGEKEYNNEEEFNFKTDDNNEFKFVVISDTRIGSKAQQLNILNDIYQKAGEMGYKNIIHCGNFTEGLYSSKHEYANSTFLDY